MVPQDVHNLVNNALKPGEPFRFRCLQCGSCCRNREDILLNPYDLHRISKELKLSPAEVLEQYCVTYIGESSRFPCVLLRPKGDRKICPLLKKGRCSVHRSKPTVCALYPLGRGVMMEKDGEAGISEPSKIIYFRQHVGCGAKDEEHTVQEWLEEFDLSESEIWFLEWSREITKMSLLIQKVERHATEEAMNYLYQTIMIKIYLDYPDGIGTGPEFLKYFRDNTAMVVQFLNQVLSDPASPAMNA